MQENYTHISVVLDRSGSMNSIKNDMIGGFNKFLTDQKAVEGKATFSLVRFDDVIETVINFVNLQEAKPIDSTILDPRGSTALLDAIGQTIDELGSKLAKLSEDEKPSKVIVMIITDGQENSSYKFSNLQIAEKIKHQTEVYQWQFIFLGANQDAIATAKSIGIAASSSITYAADSEGTKDALEGTSNLLRSYRAGKSNQVSYSDADRKKQLR